jgi:hypothetical protein
MHNRSENEMDFNQESNLVLRVLRGHNNRWHVIVDDFRQPLATFEGPHDACAWAIARAKSTRGKVFVENISVDYSAALQEHKNAPSHARIQYRWRDTNSKKSRFKLPPLVPVPRHKLEP